MADQNTYPDQTGWGPSTTGHNPSRYDYARNQSQRAVMTRLMDQAAERDTYIQALAPSAYRPFAADAERKSPAALRQGVHTSEMGQATKDMLQAGRESGMIGHGSIGATVHSLAQGSFSGIGVTTTENVRENLGQGKDGKTKYGDYVRGGKGELQSRQVGMTESVSGAGAITEKVASVMQERMVRDLYGEGTADPEDFYGMAPDEAAGLVKNVMQRSGTKNMVNIKKGATGIERMDAAIDEQGNPYRKNQLQQVRAKMDGMSEKEQQAFLNQESQNPALDPVLQKELGSIGKSDIAVQVLEKGSKSVTDTVKSVAKGVSLLKDIYGELASPAMAEALTGIDGTGSLKMARRQAAAIEKATNVANASGVDPKAMFDLMAQLAAKDAGRTNNAYNQSEAGDESGSATVRTGISAIAAEHGTKAQGLGKDAAGLAEELGFEDTSVFQNDAASVGSAVQTAMNEVKEVRNGATTTAMMIANKDERVTDTMRDLDKQFQETDSSGAGMLKRQELTAQMFEEVKRATKYRQDASPEQFGASQVAQDIAETTLKNTSARDEVKQKVLAAKSKEQEWTPVSGSLKEAGALVESESDTTASDAIRGKLGSLGLLQMKEASVKGKTKEERMTNIKAIMDEEKLTEKEQAALMPMFKEDGTLENEKAYNAAAMAAARNENRLGYTSTRQQKHMDNKENKQSTSAGQGDFFKNADGGYDVKSLVQNMGLGKQKGFSSPQETAHALEVLKTAGITGALSDPKSKEKLAKLQEQYVTDVDLSKGVDKKTIGQMNKMLGRKEDDEQLAKDLNFKSNEDLIKETKDNPTGLTKFLSGVRSETGITLSGDPSKMTMTSPDLVDATNKTGLTERLKKMALLEKVDPTRKDAGLSVAKMVILNGKTGDELNLGITADAKVEDGSYANEKKMKNSGKLVQVAQGIKDMDDTELAQFRDMDSSGQTVEALKAQAATVKAQIEKTGDASTIITTDPETGANDKRDSATAVLAELTAAIAKLEGSQGSKSAGGGGETVVTLMKVDKMEVMNPSK